MRTVAKDQELADFRARLEAELGPDPREIDRLRIRDRHGKPVDTKPVDRGGWWFKKVRVAIPLTAPVSFPPYPTLPNRHERRASSRFDRQDRAKLARVLERFNRETRVVGKSGRRNQGALKASGVEIVKALAFDFWNAKTGRLDPSHETIAARTGWSVSTVGRVLKRAARAGVISWVRRAAVWCAGGWRRKSNSYQFAPGTTVQKLDKGFDGCQSVESTYCETLRNIAQGLGCKFLS